MIYRSRCGLFLPVKIDVDEIADDLQDPVPIALKACTKSVSVVLKQSHSFQSSRFIWTYFLGLLPLLVAAFANYTSRFATY
jgi:hypothetical protein